MGFVGDLLGGGGGQEGYVSQNSPEYESAARSGIYNRLGARKKKKPVASAAAPVPSATGTGFVNNGGSISFSGTPGSPMGGAVAQPKPEEGADEWDFSQVGQNITPTQAMAGYRNSFKQYDEATNAMKTPSTFSQKYSSGYKPTAYNASKFNYQGLPAEYGNLAYEAGAKDIRREGAGNLEKIRENVGVRRPGLLLKASEQSSRDVGETLAGLNSDIRLREMEKNTDLAVQQQKDQAEENFRAAGFSDQQAKDMAAEKFKEYGSKADLEKLSADEKFRRDTGYGDMAKNRIGLISGVTENERAYKDKAMEYLLNLFQSTIGSQNQAAQQATARRGQNMDFMSSLIPI